MDEHEPRRAIPITGSAKVLNALRAATTSFFCAEKAKQAPPRACSESSNSLPGYFRSRRVLQSKHSRACGPPLFDRERK